MTRQTRTISIVAVASTLYMLVWLRVLPVPIEDAKLDQIVPVLPWNALVWAGCYCLWEMGYGIYTFGDCNDAYKELMNDITVAKDDLRRRGVTIDS